VRLVCSTSLVYDVTGEIKVFYPKYFCYVENMVEADVQVHLKNDDDGAGCSFPRVEKVVDNIERFSHIEQGKIV
jgi:hypothetical protein